MTGYIVNSGSFILDDHKFLTYLIQSNSYDPRDLLDRGELFTERFIIELRKPDTSDRFDSIKKSIIERLETPFDDLDSKIRFLNNAAYDECQDFDILKRQLVFLKSLKLDSVVKFSENVLQRSNCNRFAVLAHGNATENSKFSFQDYKTL